MGFSVPNFSLCIVAGVERAKAKARRKKKTMKNPSKFGAAFTFTDTNQHLILLLHAALK